MKILNILCENRPLLPKKSEPGFLGKCWSYLERPWRISRRYSIVASEITLLALNTAFLVCKADSNIPLEAGEIILVGLSTVGILYMHYPIDMAWKSIQDVKFAHKVKNYPITALAAIKTISHISNVALTIGGFTAAVAGTAGYADEQFQIYNRMTLWGEIGIGVGMGLTAASTFVTYRAHQALKQDFEDEKFVATIRYCMDKDTLWKVIDVLKESEDNVESALEIVKANIETQLKVTLAGKIALTILGDSLLAIEKVYTPNSLVSAGINCGVSIATAIKISVEKFLEYKQRERLDRAPKYKYLAI